MPALWIELHYGEIKLEYEHLKILGTRKDLDGETHHVTKTVPLFDIESIIIPERVSISSTALAELMRRNIPLLLRGYVEGGVLGMVQPPTSAHGHFRLRQYQCHLKSSWCLQIAKALIQAKIYNQTRLLQRIAQNRGITSYASKDLQRFAAQLQTAPSIPSIMGFEGMASARFLAEWAAYFPEIFPFKQRSRRPPLNEVNATLSFLSAILYSEVNVAIVAAGLDASLGILHATENGRWSLALDLMEVFRSPLIEAITLDLFSHKMMKQEDFESRDGGVFLTSPGRKKVIFRYERKITQDFLSEQLKHRTSLRQQIQNTPLLLKRSLDNPEAFTPFILN